VIRRLLANISNSWRAYQLLQLSDDIEEISLSQLKHTLKDSKVKLTKFCYELSLPLIRSADDRSSNETISASRTSSGVPAPPTSASRGRHVEASEFEFNPST
jgi:hypothetical protein